MEDLIDAVRHGRLRAVTSRHLYGVLAECHAILGDLMVANIGGPPRPGEPAWVSPARHGALHDLLASDLDLGVRAAALRGQLEHVTDLVKMCLSFKQGASMRRLEYLIILILVSEVLLKLWEWRHRAAADAAATAHA